QPVELFRLAQLLGCDRLVMLGDEGAVIRPTRRVLSMTARAPRLGRSLRVAHLGVISRLGGDRLRGFGAGVGHILPRNVCFVDPRLRILGVGALAVFAGLLLAAVLLTLLAFLLVGLRAAVLAHIEGIEQIVNGVAEPGLT